MEVIDEPVKLLIDSLEKVGCPNARLIITQIVLPKAGKEKISLISIIKSFKNENPKTHNFKMYLDFLKIDKDTIRKIESTV